MLINIPILLLLVLLLVLLCSSAVTVKQQQGALAASLGAAGVGSLLHSNGKASGSSAAPGITRGVAALAAQDARAGPVHAGTT